MSTTGSRRVGHPSYKTFGLLLGQSTARARGGDRARRQDLQADRLPRLPLRRGAGPRDRRPLLRPRPQLGRHRPPAARDHRLRRPHAGPPPARHPRPRHPRQERPPRQPLRRPRHRQGDPRRPPEDGRRAWATICRAPSGPPSPTRSPPTPPAPPSGESASVARIARPQADSRSVRLRGVEPPRAFAHTDLNRARLPVPPQPRGGGNLPVARPTPPAAPRALL